MRLNLKVAQTACLLILSSLEGKQQISSHTLNFNVIQFCYTLAQFSEEKKKIKHYTLHIAAENMDN